MLPNHSGYVKTVYPSSSPGSIGRDGRSGETSDRHFARHGIRGRPPDFEPILSKRIESLRAVLSEQRSRGKLLCFISLPLSARGGGNQAINERVSREVKQHLETRFGKNRFFALSPGQVESGLPRVHGKHAVGGEYMYMWTEVLAGRSGLGAFDMVYFVGPSDFARTFGLTGEDDLGTLERFLEKESARDPRFAASVDTAEKRMDFLRYYGLRASVAFSDGAHDEWNIFRLLNQKRRKQLGIGSQIPMYFEGRQLSIGAMEAPGSPGYERR